MLIPIIVIIGAKIYKRVITWSYPFPKKSGTKIFATPAPFAEIGEYADSSVDIFVRCWCNREDYWDTKFYMLREIKNAFDQNGIEIPFNQLDINIRNDLPEAKEDK